MKVVQLGGGAGGWEGGAGGGCCGGGADVDRGKRGEGAGEVDIVLAEPEFRVWAMAIEGPTSFRTQEEDGKSGIPVMSLNGRWTS
jgi:hypothetical protein